MRSFETFFEAHAADLLRTAYLISWDESEAEDLVQECLLRVSHRWDRVNAMEMPLAYARKILVNLAFKGQPRRQQWRDALRTRVLPDAPDPEAESELDVIGTRQELLARLGLLSTQQRTVLVLRYFLDLSEAQVADVLNCSVGTVKSSGSRGLARMRQSIDQSTKEVCES